MSWGLTLSCSSSGKVSDPGDQPRETREIVRENDVRVLGSITVDGVEDGDRKFLERWRREMRNKIVEHDLKNCSKSENFED